MRGVFLLAKNNRRSNWLFLVYPDSAPDDWREVIDDLHIRWTESPLHEFDIEPTGEVIKAHWHILLQYDSLKSFGQVLEVTDSVNGTRPIVCQSPRGSVRYFAHLDNPEKYQYNPALIVPHGGADVKELLKPTSGFRYAYIKDMARFIKENNIYYYDEFFEYCAENRFDDWFSLLCDNSTMVIREVIAGRRLRRKDESFKERKE